MSRRKIACFIFRMRCCFSVWFSCMLLSVPERIRPERRKEMLRLLGILSLGRLLFGRRHYRRAYCRGLFLGGLLGYFASRNFDTGRVAEDVRKTVRETKRSVRKAIHRTQRELREARRAEQRQQMEERLEELRAEAEARRAGRMQRETEPVKVIRALPESGTNEAREIQELAEDLERDARTAAMAVDAPVIEFPEEEGKYNASRKYGYV